MPKGGVTKHKKLEEEREKKKRKKTDATLTRVANV